MKLGRICAAALLLLLVLLVSAPVAAAETPTPRNVVVIQGGGMSLEQLLQVPEVASLAAAGGAGWRPTGSNRPALPISANIGIHPEALGATIRSKLSELGHESALVIVMDHFGTPFMEEGGLDLAPVVLAEGSADQLLMANGPPRTITSDSTHRIGLVTQDDLAATMQAFLGKGAAACECDGNVVHFVNQEPPPDLSSRDIEHDAIAFPIQVAAGIAVTIIGLLSVALVALRKRIPRIARTLGPWLTLTPAVLASALLAAGSLPHLTYVPVVPFVVIVTAVGAAIPLLWRHRGVLSPPAILGIGVLLFFLIEAALGWPSTLTTLFGGTALDGVRFYGLPNVFEGLIYGSGLYIAATRKRWTGVALLFALGMFAGFPGLGADLGGALACLAAAGLWLALAEREKRDTPLIWRLVQGGLLALGGLIVVLVANRLAPTPTHITAFTESGGGGILHTISSRLGVGWDLLMRNPFGFIPVIGILVLLVIVLKPTKAIGESFAAYPAWRTAMLVLVLTSVMAYFANDTGVAASGQGFAMALAGLLYVPLAMIPRKMDA